MSVRLYVISGPPIIKVSHFIKDTNGTPFIVWQQQMEKAYIKIYKIVHHDRPDRFYDMEYTKDIDTQFRRLQLTEDYNSHHIDPEYGNDQYWDDELYDKENLQFRQDDYPPTDDEEDPEIENNKLSRAVIELWQPNSKATQPEEIEEYRRQEVHQTTSSLLDEKAFLHVLVSKE